MRKLKYLLIGAVCAISISANSLADVLRYIDFEGGPQSFQKPHHLDYPFLLLSGNSPTVVTSESGVSPRKGKYMMKTFLNRGWDTSRSDRTEVDLKNPKEFKKGNEYWIAVSVFLPANWSLDYGNTGDAGMGYVLQIHGRPYTGPGGTGRKIQPLVIQHTKTGWNLKNVTKSDYNAALGGDGGLKSFSKKVPYTLGKWTDFVINFRVSGASSPDDSNGFIRVWVNGKQELDISGKTYHGENEEGPYLKIGLYNSTWKYPDTWDGSTTSTRTLYHDELRIGDASSSFNQVSPSGSAPEPTPSAPPSPPQNIRTE